MQETLTAFGSVPILWIFCGTMTRSNVSYNWYSDGGDSFCDDEKAHNAPNYCNTYVSLNSDPFSFCHS